MDVFQRYAPFIQDYIYRRGWRVLKAIQAAAGEAIFGSDANVLLAASTASGKTEAAFFPILTLLSERPPQSVGVLYIAPTKALINDQFLRLQDLCLEGDIPVWHWHGDVSQGEKRRLLDRPSGILQITPESLEALLLRRSAQMVRLFGDLRFVVIDEVHSLMRGDRGAQTLCLLERLGRLIGAVPRRVGLSATIGEPQAAGEFLASGTGRPTAIPRTEAPKLRWRLSMEHFYVSGPPERQGLPREASAVDPGLNWIFRRSRGKKCLVFTNSREECETVTTALRHYSQNAGEGERFLIHHGNLSASFREDAEALMKEEDQNLTAVATATLELGIDIGRLERAFQIDAPFTVSAFLQRMGRTGRRGQPQEMEFVIREEPPEARAPLPATLPWKLLQAIALVQLYLQHQWVEPPRLDRRPYSLAYHQTMSYLASQGETAPAKLASQILTLGAFQRITKEDYQLLLRHLIATDQIQRTAEGGLILGLAGERQVNSFRFYAVFRETEEYTVRCQSQELGTIAYPPSSGDKIALAGRVWTVEEADHKRHLIYCRPAEGIVPAYFGQCPGDVHRRVLEKMAQVLAESRSYSYLMKGAAARLEEARQAAARAGMADSPLIGLGGRVWCLFPWLGTYGFLALERLIRRICAKELGLESLEVSRPYFMQLTMKATPGRFFQVLAQALEGLDPMELLYPGEVPVFDKYDQFLPPELVRKGFALSVLDLESVRLRVGQWQQKP